MAPNLYEDSASLYDFGNDRSQVAADIQFYLTTILTNDSVLEVGCGTGRVALALAERGNAVTGIDLSEPMLDAFKAKLSANPSIARSITLHAMDMRTFDLSRIFDWIIFPFRVFQALTSDEDRQQCLSSVLRHMSESSRAIVTLFNPMKAILDNWGSKNILDFERVDKATGRTIRRYQDQLWHDRGKQIFAVNMRHEIYERDALVETLVDALELGYLYPGQCIQLFADCGFEIEHAFGYYDRRPLQADEQKEQIYILRKMRSEPK